MKLCGCGRELAVTDDGCGVCLWQCLCPNCYDPSEGSTARDRVSGYGGTAEAAIEAWEESYALAHDT